MSLFGNNTTSTAAPAANAAGSLFGTPLKRSSTLPLATDTNTEKKPFSLFPPAANTQPTTSLFSNTAATQAQQPSATSLFGAPTTSTQPSSGLFGSTTASKPLFGTSTTATNNAAPTQSTNASSLFGPPKPSTNLGASLFGNSTNTTSNTGNPTLFAGLSQPATQGLSQSQQQATPNQSAYFDQMLERGKKRNVLENGTFGELPSLHLGLADIARKARNLGTGGPTATEAKTGDARAHYLLAASGVSTASALRDINSFNTQIGNSHSNGNGNIDTDLDTYVAGIRTQSTLELIQEGLAQSRRDFDRFLEENVQMNWDDQRKKIYDHFGLKTSNENGSFGASTSTRGGFKASLRQSRNTTSVSGMSFGASGLKKSVLGSSVTRSTLRASTATDAQEKFGSKIAPVIIEDRATRERMDRYAVKVTMLNQARNQNLPYAVTKNFAEVERDGGESNAEFIINAYKALAEIVGEAEVTKSRERAFTKDYLDANTKSVASSRMRVSIINGSRKCLEKLFLDKLCATVEKDPRTANLGGVPSPINKVRGYIRIMESRKNLLVSTEDKEANTDLLKSISFGDGPADYFWVLLFYLLRSGLVQEASKFVVENQRPLRSLDRNISRYLEAYASDPERKLSPELRNELLQFYKQKVTLNPDNQIDPYMIACYKILGRIEMSKKSLENIPVNEEDWIWLQFTLARETDRTVEAQGEAFGLEQLRDIIKDIEKRHFSQDQDGSISYGIFFFLQVLAGLFEQATALLYSHNHVAGVHFSIALSYYGLIQVAGLSAGDILTFNSQNQPLLQFPLMVGYYTGSFRSAKPEVATDYLCLLALNADAPGEAGKQQGAICLDALRELVLETREFAQLIGDIRNDGTKLPGAIQLRATLIRKALPRDQAVDVNVFIKTLTTQAAIAADESGRITDAVLLYHLAEQFDTVLTVINRTLSEALTVELGREALRLQPLKPRDQNPEVQDQSTLSLTSVEDPAILAKNMYGLYTGANRQSAYDKIKSSTRTSTEMLIQMATAKQYLLSRNFIATVEIIGAHINVLPLTAKGDIGMIRGFAQQFNQLPPVLARTIGDLLIWTVLACNGERERLLKYGWETDNRKQTVKELGQAISDLGVYAGLVKYKLRSGVFEVLAKAAGESN